MTAPDAVVAREDARPARSGRVLGHEATTPLSLAVSLTVALTPVLVPAGPGNTALADVFMTASIVLVALTLSASRGVVRVPYAGGVALLVIGGLSAALVNDAPAHVVLVIAQDLLLLLWAAALAFGATDARVLQAATRAWCRTAPVLATIGVLSYLVGFAPLSGVTARDGSRASYTFDDPNLAGNYLVMSLLIMFACRRPVHRRVRLASYAIVLTALVLTGSNGGMLSLMLAVSGCVILSVLRRVGATAAVVTLGLCGALTVAGAVYVGPRVDLGAVRAAAAASIPILRDSVGRSDGSARERQTLFTEGTRLWFSGDGAGYGPARTKATLLAFQAPYVKEAHNDYLATLLERGPIGVMGLLTLVLAVSGHLRRILVGRVSGAWQEAVPRAWALVVVGPVVALAASFYEVLHFRHVWTWLGIVAAVSLANSRSVSRSRPDGTSESRPHSGVAT